MFIQKSSLTTDFSGYISLYLIIHMYNPAVSTDSVMVHISLRVYHHKYCQKLMCLFEGVLCFIYYWGPFSALLDRYSREMTGKHGRQAAKGHGSDSNPGWPFGMWSPAQYIVLNQCPRCPVFYAVCITTVTGSCLEALLSTLEPEVTMFG